MKKDYIRVGDTVEIINPSFVKRVGYPLSVEDVYEEMLHKHGAAIDGMLGLKGASSPLHDLMYSGSTYDRILRILCYDHLKKIKFGGNARTIHTYQSEAMANKQCIVYSKRNVRTGNYYPPCGSCDDWECGGLDRAKTHVLLSVVGVGDIWQPTMEIEAINVRKVVQP